MVKMLQEARALLLDPVRRGEYDKTLGQDLDGDRGPPEASVPESDSRTLVQQGWELLAEAKVASAIKVARMASERDPRNPDAWALLGQAKFRWGETADAIYEYRRATDLAPDRAQFHFDLGCIYESVKKLEEALLCYTRAAEIEPDVVLYKAGMGTVLGEMGRYAESVDVLAECVKRDPQNKGYKRLLAMAMNEMVIDSWTPGPDGLRYCVSEESAKRSHLALNRAYGLDFEDDQLRQTLVNNLKTTKWALKKHWTRGIGCSVLGFLIVMTIGAILAGVLFGRLPDPQGSLLGFLFLGGVIYLWIRLGRRPGWKINKDSLGL
jgi:Flp pilus assembly protein TadD